MKDSFKWKTVLDIFFRVNDYVSISKMNQICTVILYYALFLSRHVRHWTSSHVTSWNVMSQHVTECHITSNHRMSCHVTSHHRTSCHVTSSHVMSRHSLSHQTKPTRAISINIAFIPSGVSHSLSEQFLFRQKCQLFAFCLFLFLFLFHFLFLFLFLWLLFILIQSLFFFLHLHISVVYLYCLFWCVPSFISLPFLFPHALFVSPS